MEHSHALTRQSDPAEAVLGGEHGDRNRTQLAVQSPTGSCKTTTSSAVASKLLILTILWFAVLLYGLVPSRHDTSMESRFTHARVKGAVTSSSWCLHARFNYESILAELTSYSAYNSSTLPLSSVTSPWTAVPESLQAADLHTELAHLVDLCPLLQAEPDTYTRDFPGFAHVCDASRYALPCRTHTKNIDSSSLARFSLACSTQHACRSWWLQHQSQHGVCGCAPLVMNLDYPNQHASQVESRQGSDHSDQPWWTACVWLLIQLGRLSAPCCSVVQCTDRHSRQHASFQFVHRNSQCLALTRHIING